MTERECPSCGEPANPFNFISVSCTSLFHSVRTTGGETVERPTVGKLVALLPMTRDMFYDEGLREMALRSSLSTISFINDAVISGEVRMSFGKYGYEREDGLDYWGIATAEAKRVRHDE